MCLGEIVILLLSTDQGELATGVLAMWALGLFIAFVTDRSLVKLAGYRKTILIEIVFLLLLPFIYLYLNKATKININTQKPYFILVYGSYGMTKKQIPLSGLFDHAITFKNDSIIYLDYSFLNDNSVYVLEPKSWGGYKSKYLDTIINSNKREIQMRSNDLSDEQRDSIFKKLLSTLHLQ